MNKTGAFQATFAGGMIEGIKQDQQFERSDGALSSVLWLENYNHTLQEDSAIKRWGEVDSGGPLLDLGYFCPNEVYSGVVNGGNDYEVNRAALLQGVQMYSVVHPQYNDNITTFLKRYPNTTTSYTYDYVPQWIIDAAILQSSEAVAVVSHTISRDGQSAVWQEVWADGVTDYPGWYTFGTLGDVTRYGETLLFTTELADSPYFENDGTKNPVNDYLYPVYRYLYWDIRKKRSAGNQFLNTSGADDYFDIGTDTTGKYAKWKVLPPAQFVVNTMQVGLVKGVKDGTTFTNVDGGQDLYDINIIIDECPSYGWKHDHIPNNQSILATYKPTWMEDVFYTEQTSSLGINCKVPIHQVYSMETIDIPLLNDKIYEPNVLGTGFTYLSSGAEIAVHSIGSNEPMMVSGVQKALDIVSGSAFIYSAVSTNHEIVSTGLTKYTESKTPRMFLYKEKLDLVLTANIGGIEVVLWRGDYTVEQEPMLPSSTETFPSLGYPIPTHFMHDIPFFAKTTSLPEVYLFDVSAGDYSTQLNELGKLFLQGRSIGAASFGYHLYHVYGSFLYFSLEVLQDTMRLLIDSGCSALSLWCVKPDSNRHTLKSIGATADSPSGNIYNKPQQQGNENVDYTKYALLKRFVIDGRTEPVVSYKDWVPGATLSTNSWLKRNDPGIPAVRDPQTYYTAVPLTEGTTGVPYSTIPVYPTDANVMTYLDNAVALRPNVLDTEYWTPDFVIWDYPTETTLFLNSSGKYWKGLGAKLITVIKGRTFIGGCIGADGIEEQAILRYSDVQGGAISPDIFSEERKIQVGHMPHTALLEFREQLWAFSRYQFYRIGMASITQEETWEFFDVVEQGCFNVKSAIVVPYGVCFCNEAGVWLSEGGEPQNLALPILPTYQHISSGTQYLYTTINQLDGVPYIDEKGINPYMEMNYDSFNDEILISSPLFTVVQNDDNNTDYLPNTDFTMIFSFKYKTWRIESSVVPPYELEIQ